jgi:hypothetical protein
MTGFDKLSPQRCALSPSTGSGRRLSKGGLTGFDKLSPQRCALILSKGALTGFDKLSPQRCVQDPSEGARCWPTTRRCE